MQHKQNDYSDILHLPHHQSAKHKHMSLHDRAAQFAPFAALKGYDGEIDETARLTEKRFVLSEEQAFTLNARTHILREHLREQPVITVTHFVPDMKKAGGTYHTKTGALRRIDEVQRIFCFTDGTEIELDNIYEIDGAVFQAYHEGE